MGRGAYPGPGDGATSSADAVIDRLAWLMDGFLELPGGYRIGLDPIIGLVPGIGDLITTMVSSAIVLQAQRAGIPRATLLRMIANVAIDAVLGAIPFAGDLFDFAFKANVRNVKLYREARAGVRRPGRDAGFLLLMLIVLGLIVAVPIFAIVYLFRALF